MSSQPAQISNSQTGQFFYQSLTPPPFYNSSSPNPQPVSNNLLDKDFEADIFQQNKPIQNVSKL